jgi:glycosyltransferase involved in cell wall biosynthesis
MHPTLIIIPLSNQSSLIESLVASLSGIEDADVLFVDDGSEDGAFDILGEIAGVKTLRHDQSLGFGSSVQSGLKFARDMGYRLAVFIDPLCTKAAQDISAMRENISYGYDMVCCSRILENYDHQALDLSLTEMTQEISARVRELTSYDLTDPLSGIRAINLDSIKDMDLTDETHGVFLQLCIQCAHFGLEVLEIPLVSESLPFGRELELYDDGLGFFLSLMETESYLYRRDSIN